MLSRAATLCLLSLLLGPMGTRSDSLGERPAPREGTVVGQEPPAEPPSEDPDTVDEEQPPEKELSPEEQAKLEELKRKREERQKKRQERKEREKEKTEDRIAKDEAQYRERLDQLLERGYAALAAEDLRKAEQAFSARLALEKDSDFQARMGLARTLVAKGELVEAIEQSLRAVRDADSDEEKAEALVFAGDLSLRSIPRDEATNAPLPGSELYVTTARRYYIQAVRADPQGASEARSRMEEIFPTPPDERTDRLYGRFLELAPNGAAEQARYLAAAYDALLTGSSKVPVAVAGGITAPTRTSGQRPSYPRPLSGKPPRRLLASLIIDSDGSVAEARILNGIDARHDRAAVEAFATWTFEPARLPDGTPVPVHYLAGAQPVLTDPLPPEPTSEADDSESPESGEAEGGEAGSSEEGGGAGASDGSGVPESAEDESESEGEQ